MHCQSCGIAAEDVLEEVLASLEGLLKYHLPVADVDAELRQVVAFIKNAMEVG